MAEEESVKIRWTYNPNLKKVGKTENMPPDEARMWIREGRAVRADDEEGANEERALPRSVSRTGAVAADAKSPTGEEMAEGKQTRARK